MPIKEVLKKEIIKWFDVGVIYTNIYSNWVCHVLCLPKKGGIIMVPYERNELIPMRQVTGWRVYMEYLRLNP